MSCNVVNNAMRQNWCGQSGYVTRALFAAVYLWVVPAGAEEQMEQETIVIKGSQGLPRVLYIAPWKRVGEPLEGGALEGEIGEETEPLERDLFRRELELQREGYSIEQPSPRDSNTGPTAGTGTAR
jgi:hypothetical protein